MKKRKHASRRLLVIEYQPGPKKAWSFWGQCYADNQMSRAKRRCAELYAGNELNKTRSWSYRVVRYVAEES